MCEVKHKVVPGPVTSGGVRVNECVHECVCVNVCLCAVGCVPVCGCMGVHCVHVRMYTHLYIYVYAGQTCVHVHTCVRVCV